MTGVRIAIVIAFISLCVILNAQLQQKAVRPRYNLVLISLDTLRAERLGSYGYHRPTSPNFDALASESALFEQAVTTSSWTLPAHATIFTGLYPISHGVRSGKGRRIADDTDVFTEQLKTAGYRTFAVTGGAYVARVYGFDRGFDSYLQRSDYIRGARSLRSFPRAVEIAKERINHVPEDQPYFLFLHTYDIHCPYIPPKKIFGRFNSPGAEPIKLGKCGYDYYKQKGLSQAQALYLSDRYDEGILGVDEVLGGFLDFLRNRPDYERTIVVVTSDHGEEFMEHGGVGHKGSLYRELLLVPLIIRDPRGGAIRIKDSVSLVDLYPTMLELLGLDVPAHAQGSSLAGIVLGSPEETYLRPFQFSELQRGRVLISKFGPEKHLIVNIEDGTHEFYDHLSDPLEAINLAAEGHPQLQAAIERLQQFTSKLAGAQAGAVDDSSAEHLEQLRTLGYL